MSHKIFDDSSFTLKSRANSWVIPPDNAVLVMHELTPNEIQHAIMGIFLNVEEEDIEDMNEQACADALIINAILTASRMTDCNHSELIRHLGMPYKYLMAFQQLEKTIYDTPTSEELKEMFEM